MPIISENKNVIDDPTWTELKDIYLAKKQGEALERASTALNFDEAVSLGNFNHQAVYALGVLESHQGFILSLTGYRGNILNRFIETVCRASGSIQGKRMQLTFESVGTLGQYIPMGKRDRQDPEEVDFND